MKTSSSTAAARTYLAFFPPPCRLGGGGPAMIAPCSRAAFPRSAPALCRPCTALLGEPLGISPVARRATR
eukprot:CAMPEP_0182872640 /NCGR_PEP_ID=MMETSP0034_2-20130328/11840_1 /TAXON_ID=156128 /ORGANISM="Nephroselmis pyriformis, Strain CCMP717" /LENGTH=69 /DNA_ID=CAMNT_0025005243 /DNA_START=77 /DNA_END=283 /DNA_ORIENTATION=+